MEKPRAMEIDIPSGLPLDWRSRLRPKKNSSPRRLCRGVSLTFRCGLCLIGAILAFGLAGTAAANPATMPNGDSAGVGYDPLRVDSGAGGTFVDLVVPDPERNRQIPLRVYLPAGEEAAPVVVFSPGLGGTCTMTGYLGKHWSGRGYAVVYIQHPGSDDSVWKGIPPGQRQAAMAAAANGRNLLLRVKDVPVALDQLEVWNREAGHPLAGRLDMTRVGMSGHSFGAFTTQSLCGQSSLKGDQRFLLPGIRAAIMFSPSLPRLGDPVKAFAGVKIPWLVMTGTRDEAKIGHQTVASRLAVFPALPPGNKYEVVLFEGAHFAFTERDPMMFTTTRNPNHHRVILAIATAFWDAFLRNDPAARAWLDGDGPATVLEPQDRWQKK